MACRQTGAAGERHSVRGSHFFEDGWEERVDGVRLQPLRRLLSRAGVVSGLAEFSLQPGHRKACREALSALLPPHAGPTPRQPEATFIRLDHPDASTEGPTSETAPNAVQADICSRLYSLCMQHRAPRVNAGCQLGYRFGVGGGLGISPRGEGHVAGRGRRCWCRVDIPRLPRPRRISKNIAKNRSWASGFLRRRQ